MIYNHDVGAYVRFVMVDGKERMQVRRGKEWVFWTADDRARPLIEWAKNESSKNKSANQDKGN